MSAIDIICHVIGGIVACSILYTVIRELVDNGRNNKPNTKKD